MAEWALALLGPAIEEVGGWVAAPLKSPFIHLCCFTSNIAALEDVAKTLEYKARNLKEKVGADKNNGREDIDELVKDWLTASDDAIRKKERILDEATEVDSGVSNYRKRVSLSKEAMETAEAMKKLIQECKFDTISHPPPIVATSEVTFGKVIYEFHSRRRFEEDIITSLDRSKNVDKVGVWGIGGVGKTIMAQKILNRALKEGLFDEVVTVTVSQPVDKLVIQKNIAEQLGLTLEDETLRPRAAKLSARLMQKNRTLLLLDDVWEVLNLEELGIPCDGKWCTIILTSRNKDVLKGMKVEKVCELGVLDEDEAWDFFKKMAGTCVDDAILKPISFEVMKECKGLLIALESVGKAHEDEKSRVIWTDSLEQLRRNNPVDIPNVIEEVYKPLKLSYDRLESENAKLTFLLCCLFAEDADISLEHLTYFAMGLRLFNDTWELEKVRGRIRRSTHTLRNRSLLLDGSDEDHVKMHDVVRDVSIFIAKEKRMVKCSNCTWISSHLDIDGGATRDPTLNSCFSNLKLLWMAKKYGEQEMEVDLCNLTGGSTELNVLFIKNYTSMESLPALKTSLTTLVLQSCDSLKSIAVVGQLESLEILICHDCKSIKELPVQVKGLKRLKRLEISSCYNLKRIATGVISSMVSLEELKIEDSFDDWTGWEIHEEGNEAPTNAGLREIESLKKLRCLNIEVSETALVAQPLDLSLEVLLVQFSIKFGAADKFIESLSTKGYQRRMFVRFPLYGRENICFNWGDLSTNKFLTCTECLHARGTGTGKQYFNLNLESAPSIRWLQLDKFENISSIVAALPLLECLSLSGILNLEEIWGDAPIPSNSFNNLKYLELKHLSALKRMGKTVLSTAKDFFLQLETIKISMCEEMEELVLVPSEQEQGNHHISTVLIFPKLKTLHLYFLPKLSSMICSRGIESIQFPLLAEIHIVDCQNLKWISDNQDYHDDDDSSHLLCGSKVSFPNLEKLKLKGNRTSKNVWCDRVPMGLFRGLVKLDIFNYDNIRRLFSLSSKIPQNLVSLQMLCIAECKEMVTVIEDDEDIVSSSSSCHHPTNPTTSTPLFPSLRELELYHLPKLESFCEWRRCADLELKKPEIYDCNEMCAGSLVIAPALQTIIIDEEDFEYFEWGDDLNAALHEYFEEAKRVREEEEEEEEEEGEGEEEDDEEDEEEEDDDDDEKEGEEEEEEDDEEDEEEEGEERGGEEEEGGGGERRSKRRRI